MAEIEVYTRHWCPYCAKVKALLRAKGLDFLEVDISREPERESEMLKRSGMRSVPQLFIDGDWVGGYEALAQLNASGELDRRLGLPEREMRAFYDLAIIGAGPAGLVAAHYAARKSLQTVLISLDLGGQVTATASIANYPGLGPVTGPDLVQTLHEQMAAYPVDQLIGEQVVTIRIEGSVRVLITASGREICARAVIIATGAQKRRLGIPGEVRLTGHGVVYCSTCDGPLFRGKPIAVVGGGNSGLQAALEMHGQASELYLVSRDGWSGDQVLQDKLAKAGGIQALKQHVPVEVLGEEKVTGLVVEDEETGDRRTLPVEGVFIEVGFYPNSELVLDLLDTNEFGEVTVDEHGRTGIPGIFAAGDVTDNHDKQIVLAAGDGARAALGAFEYVIKRL